MSEPMSSRHLPLLAIVIAPLVLIFAAAATVYHAWRSDQPLPITGSPAEKPSPSRTVTEAGPVTLADATRTSGVAFCHNDGGSGGRKYLVETVSAGLALFDYDGDGWIDICFLNGAPLPPASPDDSVVNALYRNEGGMRFRDVTHAAGLADAGYGLGVVAGDYDGDGLLDLYLNNFGPNVLYRNNGDGTFTDVTAEAGVGCGNRVGAGAAFLDADRDGDLDLYVSHYIEFDWSLHRPRSIDGFPCYPGPLDYDPAPDVLFRNNGDGTFTDVSAESGFGLVAGNGMGMICTDFDNDGDTDVLVMCDEGANLLFENDGTGVFRETAVTRGMAFDYQGHSQGSMGVDCGDYDRDGWLDFFSTSFSREFPVLYRNVEGRYFEDVTLVSNVGTAARPHVNWGTAFPDLDNDGHIDLFLACGHIDQEVHLWNPNTAFRVPNIVLRNQGDGYFEDISAQSGEGLRVTESSRGVGVDDLDNDGDLDIVILNSRAPATVLRNDTHNGNDWLQIQLVARDGNRHGIGAHVRVVTDRGTQLAEVHSGRGYQSHYGQRLHFGLGPCAVAKRVEVRWITGQKSVIENVAANQLLKIYQPAGDSSR